MGGQERIRTLRGGLSSSGQIGKDDSISTPAPGDISKDMVVVALLMIEGISHLRP